MKKTGTFGSVLLTVFLAGCLLLDPGPDAYLRSRGWRVATWTRATAIDEAWGRIAPAGTSLLAGAGR